MLFKDLQKNFPVFAIENTSDLRVLQGKVIDVTAPRFDDKSLQPPFSAANMTMTKVVDVTIEIGDKQMTFVIPDNASSTCTPQNLILLTDRESVVRELNTIKTQAEIALKDADMYRAKLKTCSEVLSEWDTTFKEKKETDERLSNMEESIKQINDSIQKLITNKII